MIIDGLIERRNVDLVGSGSSTMSTLSDEVKTLTSEDFGFKKLGQATILPSYNGKLPFASLQNLDIDNEKTRYVASSGGKVVVGDLQLLRDFIQNDGKTELTFLWEKELSDVILVKIVPNEEALILSKNGTLHTVDLKNPGDLKNTSIINGALLQAQLYRFKSILLLSADCQLQTFDLNESSLAPAIADNVASFDILGDRLYLLLNDYTVQVKGLEENLQNILEISIPQDLKEELSDQYYPTTIKVLNENQLLLVFGEKVSETDEDVMYDHKFYIVDHSASETTFSESFDVTPAFGSTLRYPTSYNVRIKQLTPDHEVINILASACSSEVTIWDSIEVVQPSQDSERAVLPISKTTDNDTNPIGVSLDVCTNGSIAEPCPGVDSIERLPLIYILNDEGSLQIVGLYHSSAIKSGKFEVKNVEEEFTESTGKEKTPTEDVSSGTGISLPKLSIGDTHSSKDEVLNTASGTSTEADSKPEVESKKLLGSSLDTKQTFENPAYNAPSLSATEFKSSSLGASDSKPAFGSPSFSGSDSKFSFNNAPLANSASKSALEKSSFQNQNSSSAFGAPSFGGVDSKPAFGAPSFGGSEAKSASGGSGGSEAKPAFGKPSFENFDSKSAFGAPSLGNSDSKPAFGKPLFGGSDSKPAFGTATFGTPTFGSSDSKSPFGQSSLGGSDFKPAFGTPSFGSSESKPAFGKPSFATSESKPAFGTPSFGSSESKPAFGAPSFGGSESKAAFGKPSFGSSDAKSAFGTPSFGSSDPNSAFGRPAFGDSTSKPAFGTPSFGDLASKPAFGKAAFGSNTFGAFNNSGTSPAAARSSFSKFAGENPFTTKKGEGSPFASLSANKADNTTLSPFNLKTSQSPFAKLGSGHTDAQSSKLKDDSNVFTVNRELGSSDATDASTDSADTDSDYKLHSQDHSSSFRHEEKSQIDISSSDSESETEQSNDSISAINEQDPADDDKGDNNQESLSDSTIEQTPSVLAKSTAKNGTDSSSISAITARIKAGANISGSNLALPQHDEPKSADRSRVSSPFSTFANDLKKGSPSDFSFAKLSTGFEEKAKGDLGEADEQASVPGSSNSDDGERGKKPDLFLSKFSEASAKGEATKESLSVSERSDSQNDDESKEKLEGEEEHQNNGSDEPEEFTKKEIQEAIASDADNSQVPAFPSHENHHYESKTNSSENLVREESYDALDDVTRGELEAAMNDTQSMTGNEEQANEDVNAGIKSGEEKIPITQGIQAPEVSDNACQTDSTPLCDFETQAFHDEELYVATQHKPLPLPSYYSGANVTNLKYSTTDPIMRSFEKTYQVISAEISVLRENACKIKEALKDQSTQYLEKRSKKTISNVYTWRIPESKALQAIVSEETKCFYEKSKDIESLNRSLAELELHEWKTLKKNLSDTKNEYYQCETLEVNPDLGDLRHHQSKMQLKLRQKMSELTDKVENVEELLRILKLCTVESHKFQENPYISKLVRESANRENLLNEIVRLREEIRDLNLAGDTTQAHAACSPGSLGGDEIQSAPVVEYGMQLGAKKQLGELLKGRPITSN